MIFKNSKVYDWLKWIVITVFPAVIGFFELMVQTWNIPHGAPIVITLAGLNTLLGAVIGISGIKYNKLNK